MRIFITGATGFIGTELVKELIASGHQVRGLSRSEAGLQQLQAAGVEPQRGVIQDLDCLRRGAEGMDAVVNLAFNHDDMSRFAESGADERSAIEAMGQVLQPGALLVVTSGVGLLAETPDRLRVESDPPLPSAAIPRQPEAATEAAAARGVRVGIVRLPQVHDTRRQGLVSFLIETARQKRLSAYVGDGSNRWAAAPLADVAHLYRLVLERPVERPVEGTSVYHAVAEEGVSLREIAETVGRGLKVPVVSIPPGQAQEHFGFLAHFAATDMTASSEWTRRTLGWNPAGPGLIEDLVNMNYA